jgi:cytoskeletal protein CcmA (bactofilin family)
MFWPPVILSVATGTMLALPLVPSLTELHRRRDAAPLPTRSDDGKIENFSRSLREYMAPLTELEGARSCRLRDGIDGRVLRQRDIPEIPETAIEAPTYAPESLVFTAPVCFSRELYVRGNLDIASESLLRAVLVEGDTILGERTSVARWIHVTGDLLAEPEVQLFGRSSAEGTIILRHGCTFERLRALVICTGTASTPAFATSPVWKGGSLIDMRLGRVRSNGDFHLRDSDAFQGHIVAVGKVAIEDNVLVIGSIKARTDVEIGYGTHVEGTLVSRGQTRIGEHCYVKGPVLSEGEIVIGTGTQIGTPASPTTISAPRVRIAPGAVVCGSVWARESGEVSA